VSKVDILVPLGKARYIFESEFFLLKVLDKEGTRVGK
jgi:hypothetical protein